jgi:hypothetical protein
VWVAHEPLTGSGKCRNSYLQKRAFESLYSVLANPFESHHRDWNRRLRNQISRKRRLIYLRAGSGQSLLTVISDCPVKVTVLLQKGLPIGNDHIRRSLYNGIRGRRLDHILTKEHII